jgi:hypothetical protein
MDFLFTNWDELEAVSLDGTYLTELPSDIQRLIYNFLGDKYLFRFTTKLLERNDDVFWKSRFITINSTSNLKLASSITGKTFYTRVLFVFYMSRYSWEGILDESTTYRQNFATALSSETSKLSKFVIDSRDRNGNTLLMSLVCDKVKNNYESDYLNKIAYLLKCIKTLIRSGADLNACTARGRTPLMCAIVNSYYSIARMLIDAGANVNGKYQRTGYTPLMMALKKSSTKIAEMLIDAGADVNCQYRRTGNTPLMMAILKFPSLVSKLIPLSNVFIKNKKGKIAITYGPPKSSLSLKDYSSLYVKTYGDKPFSYMRYYK